MIHYAGDVLLGVYGDMRMQADRDASRIARRLLWNKKPTIMFEIRGLGCDVPSSVTKNACERGSTRLGQHC